MIALHVAGAALALAWLVPVLFVLVILRGLDRQDRTTRRNGSR